MRIRSIVYYECKSHLQNPRAIVSIILAPVFIILVLMAGLAPIYQDQEYVERFKLGLVNYDDSFETNSLIQQFEKSKEINQVATFIRMEEERALQQLDHNELAAVIIIPENFSKDMARGINTPVQVVGNYQRPLQSMLVKGMMQSNADLVSAAQSGVNTVYHFLVKADASPEMLRDTFQQTVVYFTLHSLGRNKVFETQVLSALQHLSAAEYYAIASLLIILMLGGLIVAQSSTTGHGRAFHQRLISYGVRAWDLLLGRFISIYLLLTFQLLVILLVLLGMTKSQLDGSYTLVLLMLVLILGAIGALFTFLSSSGLKLATSNLIGLSVIVGMALVGGNIIPLAYLPHWVEKLSVLSLNKWATQGLIYSYYTLDKAMVWQSVFMLMTWVILLLLAAYWMIRRSLRNL